MSVNDSDAELLALAGDDSSDGEEEVKDSPIKSKSPTPPAAPAPESSAPASTRPPKGVAWKVTGKARRAGATKQARKINSDDDGPEYMVNSNSLNDD